MTSAFISQHRTSISDFELMCYQLQQTCWYLRTTFFFTDEGELVWVIDGKQGGQHLATDGGSLHEALWKLYRLAQTRDVH